MDIKFDMIYYDTYLAWWSWAHSFCRLYIHIVCSLLYLYSFVCREWGKQKDTNFDSSNNNNNLWFVCLLYCAIIALINGVKLTTRQLLFCHTKHLYNCIKNYPIWCSHYDFIGLCGRLGRLREQHSYYCLQKKGSSVVHSLLLYMHAL